MKENYFASSDADWLLCIIYSCTVKTLNPHSSPRICVLAQKKKEKLSLTFVTYSIRWLNECQIKTSSCTEWQESSPEIFRCQAVLENNDPLCTRTLAGYVLMWTSRNICTQQGKTPDIDESLAPFWPQTSLCIGTTPL